MGYGEVVDLAHTDAGRLFAAFVSFAGFGTLTFIFSSLTVFFLETDLNEALRRRDQALARAELADLAARFGAASRKLDEARVALEGATGK